MKNMLDDRIVIPENILAMSQAEIQDKIREIEAKRPVLKRSKPKSIVMGKTKVYIR